MTVSHDSFDLLLTIIDKHIADGEALLQISCYQDEQVRLAEQLNTLLLLRKAFASALVSGEGGE